MNYRRDIDGLRAVAILPVVLYHAGVGGLHGGYVGVDVFFVISGYLISAGILSDLAAGQWSVLRFYERRARRILPALLFVLACCLPPAWMWMQPAQLEDFGAALAATLLFVANLHAMNQSGYFAPAAETQPLLHMWSLAVEEQYYLLFPPLLAALWRFGTARAAKSVAILCLLGFGLSEWGTRFQPEKAYFFTLTRAWELGVGSLCALALRDAPPRPGNLASATGLGLILAAVFLYGRDTPFPGLHALAPVVGAALVILFGGPGTATGRLLGARVLVAIGLVSYSAYLWHQPLFAFARIRTGGEPGLGLMLGLAILTFVLAALSWRFVEQPFRRGPTPWLARRPRLFGASAAASASLLAAGAVLSVQTGFPGRTTERYTGDIGHQAFFSAMAAASFPCTPAAIEQAAERWNGFTRCRQSKPDRPITVLLLGDSHAEHLFPGLATALPGETVGYYSLGAPPFAGNPAFEPIFREIAHSRSLSRIYLTMRWSDRTQGLGAPEAIAETLRATLDRLTARGARVALVGSVPAHHIDADACKFVLDGVPAPACERPFSEILAEAGPYLPALASVAQERAVPLIDLNSLFCAEDVCAMHRGGAMLYRDSNHLNLAGSLIVGARLARGLPAGD